MNSKIHHGELCPDRDPGTSDLDAYLSIRREKEKLRASHICEDTSVKSMHLAHKLNSSGE